MKRPLIWFIWLQNHGLLIFIIPSLKEHEKCVFFIFFRDFIQVFDYKKWQKPQIKQSAHNFYILFLVFYAFLKSVNGPNLLRLVLHVMKTALRVYFTNYTLSLNGPERNHKQIWHEHKKLLTPNELREETHTKNNRYFRGRTTKVRVPPPPKDLSGSNLADISHYIKSCSVSVNARDPPPSKILLKELQDILWIFCFYAYSYGVW